MSTTSAGARGLGLRNFIVRATVASLLSLPAALPTFADDAAQYQLSIPSQPLRTALQDFSRQSGIDVLVSSRITQVYDAPVLKGRFTPTSALQHLLGGTGLTFRQLDDKTIEVQPAAAGQLVRTADVPGQKASIAAANLLAQNNANAIAQGPSPPAAASENPELTEVIVTGSRIARQDFTSLSPIVTVDAGAIQNRSEPGIVNALQQLPQFNPRGNSSNLSEASNPFPSATAAPGAATVDLRGLGTNRTLVLLDGQRAQPVNAALVVDLNTIPPEAVASVETITGGAASTYGADAISGVVNIKLKQNFQGLEVDAQQGLSQYGDSATTNLGAVLGGNFADNKGNAMLVLSYSKVGQGDQTKRGWFQAGELAPGTPGGALGGYGLQEYDYDTANMPAGPNAFASPASGTWFDQNGHPFSQYAPLATGYSGPLGLGTGYKINPDGELGYNSQIPDLKVPQTRWAALASAHYNINDSITAYARAQFSNSYTTAVGVPAGLESIWTLQIPYGPWDDPSSANFGSPPAGSTFNPVPQSLANLLNSRTNAMTGASAAGNPWQYQGASSWFGPYTTDTTNTVYQITTGLRGDLPVFSFSKDWTWDVYGSHGDTNLNSQLNGFPNLSRLQTLASANLYGQNWTNSAYPISVGGTCTSGLPIFTATGGVYAPNAQASANCNAYADPALNNVTTLTQNVYEGDIQGSLLDMPFNAGRLRFALGADYRQEEFSFTPDSGYTAYQDYPNIVQNIALPTAVSGKTGTDEIYTEFSIPLVSGLPFAKSIEIDPGIRFSQYNESSPTDGISSKSSDVKTWKLLGNWVVNDWVSVRGGLEVANRAPNINELFAPVGGTSIDLFAPDPCAVYPGTTPSWGNTPGNANRLNVQAACQYLFERGGMPAAQAAALMTPGGSANNYQYTVFGPNPSPAPFPYSIAITSGNPNLKSETARTVTAGFVLTSPFHNAYTQRMRMSVDWYQIQLDGAIANPDFVQVYQQCLDSQYNKLMGSAGGSLTGAQLVAGNPFCAFINREYAPQAGDPNGGPRNYQSAAVNEGGIQDRGIDLELDWGLRFADTDLWSSVPGGISVNIVASYLDRYAVSPFPGAAYVNYTGTVTNNSYRDKTLSTFAYSVGKVNVGFRWQHLPAAGPDPGTPDSTGAANAYNKVDFFGSYQLTDALELRGGIDNLMNAWPVWVGANGSTTAVGQTNLNYDTVGREFYLGVKAKL